MTFASPLHQLHGVGVTIKDVTKIYEMRDGNELSALDPIDLTISPGEFVAVVGPSGCGKSTLLSMIAGLLPVSSGAIQIDSQNVHRPHPKVGVVFQSDLLLYWRNVIDNILLPVEIKGWRRADYMSRAGELLEQVGLKGTENKMPDELSGGMRKRAAFARAMALDPEILFFDEPSAGLDPITAAGIDDLILSLKKAYGLTMVVVTHELASAFLIADRIVLIDRGNIAAMGPVDEVRNSQHPRVRQFLDRIADSTQDDEVDHLRIYTEGIR